MKFSDFLIESNVNTLIVKANKLVIGLLEQTVAALYNRHKFNGMFNDGDELQEFIDALKPEFEHVTAEFIKLLEKELAKLATEEVEARFGKITPYHEAVYEKDSQASWKKLWWVGNIIVWLQDKGTGLSTGGYFQSHMSEVQAKFPQYLVSHLDPYREAAVGVNVTLSHKELVKHLREAAIERVVNAGDLNFKVEDDDRLKELMHNVVDTYAHEVTHLLQYIKQNLATHARGVDGTNAYAKKNYLSKKVKDLNAIISAESSEWTEKQWEVYLSNAIEIDAHAVSVAAKILQECKNRHAGSELAAINSVLEELKSGYVYSSKSFDFYSFKIQAKIEQDKRYQTVWRRFLKKIALQLTERAEELRKQVTAEEAMYSY